MPRNTQLVNGEARSFLPQSRMPWPHATCLLLVRKRGPGCCWGEGPSEGESQLQNSREQDVHEALGLVRSGPGRGHWGSHTPRTAGGLGPAVGVKAKFLCREGQHFFSGCIAFRYFANGPSHSF